MPTVLRSEVRRALRGCLQQTRLDRDEVITRINNSASIKTVPLTVVAGTEGTESILTALMATLERQLGQRGDITLLD